MWLYRGVQSAVFYYATCTPCAMSVDRRKRKKEAARSHREKEKINATVTDQPRPFPQPTAFRTNQGWKEEIALGPGPPARRGGHRNAHRRTESWKSDARPAEDVEQTGGSAQKKDKGGLMQPVSDRWNRMRYQREDEPLWGEEVEVKGSSVGISGQGRTEAKEPKYYIARVPPVNDLHPPIVSGPKSRAETRWMLQPPPSARVMAGKERTSPSTKPREKRASPTPPGMARNYQLPPISTQTSVKKKTLKPSPTFTSPSDAHTPTTSKTKTEDQLARSSSPTASAYGCDESNFVISRSLHSRCDSSMLMSSDSEMESPRVSMHSPQTPVSRPGSKETEDAGKHFRPSISKALTTLPRETNNKVQLLHVEINEPHDEVGLGQLEQIRPWRWSMDV
ncbi:hypothetical protein N8T08_005878 [Aspergillus melleus]|uniref:Uncharacterized protein n=1 Tax=Aspergillus melleus TaxID=138277 RepID=A0ACC3B1W7_9EURO|nr:hypothetical protein N8T08_005878 [Aspergillus melleus]